MENQIVSIPAAPQRMSASSTLKGDFIALHPEHEAPNSQLTAHSSQLTAQSSKLKAHSSQLTAHSSQLTKRKSL